MDDNKFYKYNNNENINIEKNENKEEKKVYFQYKLKLRTAVIGFVLFLLLSSTNAYKILNIIFKSIFNIKNTEILDEKNEPSLLGKIIMGIIIFIILFIF
jgi:hypothetical protein